MPITWNELRVSEFKKGSYLDSLPTGEYLITLDLSAWGQGSSAGVHIYFTTDMGERYWSFIKWFGASPEYILFKEGSPGDRFKITVATRIKSGKAFIKAAERIP